MWQPPAQGSRGEPEYDPQAGPDPTDRRSREQQRADQNVQRDNRQADDGDIEERAEKVRDSLDLPNEPSDEEAEV